VSYPPPPSRIYLKDTHQAKGVKGIPPRGSTYPLGFWSNPSHIPTYVRGAGRTSSFPVLFTHSEVTMITLLRTVPSFPVGSPGYRPLSPARQTLPKYRAVSCSSTRCSVVSSERTFFDSTEMSPPRPRLPPFFLFLSSISSEVL